MIKNRGIALIISIITYNGVEQRKLIKFLYFEVKICQL